MHKDKDEAQFNLETTTALMLEFALRDVIKQTQKIKRELHRRLRKKKFKGHDASMISIAMGHLDSEMSGAMAADANLNAKANALDGYPTHVGPVRKEKHFLKKGEKVRLFTFGREEKYLVVYDRRHGEDHIEDIYRLARVNDGISREIVEHEMVGRGVKRPKNKTAEWANDMLLSS